MRRAAGFGLQAALVALLAAAPLRDAAQSNAKPVLSVQLGHSTYIWSVAYSYDGRFILTGSADATACLWDARTGREIRRFTGHTDMVRSATLSPDGRFALTGSFDGSARTWDVATGKQARQFDAQSKIMSVAFSPDGRSILTAGDDTRLWDAATGKEARRWPVKAWSAVFSPDGRLVLTRSYDDAALWNREDGRQVLKIPTSGNGAAVFSPDGHFVVVPNGFSAATVFDARSGKEVRRVNDDSFSIDTVAFSADGRYIVTGGSKQVSPSDPTWKDGDAAIWDEATGRMIRRVVISGRNSWGPDETLSAVFSPDGRFFVTGSSDSIGRLWDSAKGEEVMRFENQASYISAMAISPDGRSLVTGGGDGMSYQWNLSSGQESNRFEGDGSLVYSIAFSPDGKLVLRGSAGHSTALFNAASGKAVHSFIGPEATVESVGFAKDGRSVFSAVLDGTVWVWNATSGEKMRRLNVINTAYASAFSPDGSLFAAGMRGARDHDDKPHDFTVAVWKTGNGEEVRRLVGHSADLSSMAFSPDGRRIVTASKDQTTRVWEISTGREIRRLAAGAANRVVFSPDGGSILTGGDDGIARLWDAETGREIRRFTGPATSIEAVAFTPDGRFIATGGMDSMTTLWDRATGRDLCRLISFRDGVWAVVAPDGRFDTNNLELIRGLSWVLPDAPLETLPVEIFMRDYYEPRLLSRILSGEEFPAMQPLTRLNRIQPEVTIAKAEAGAKPDTVSVTVTVKDGGDPKKQTHSGAFDLRLFRDHQLVGYEPKTAGAQPAQIMLGEEGTRTIRFPDIRLPHNFKDGPKEGKVVFTAYAFNSDRVKSSTAQLTYTVPALAAVKGTAYIITIGVNVTENAAWRLQYAANDARSMNAALLKSLKGTGEYGNIVPVTLISDDAAADLHLPAKATIQTVFDLLAGRSVSSEARAAVPNSERIHKATPDDLVLISFSGHGYRGPRGTFYLIPYDTGREGDSLMGILARMISSDDLSLWLRDVDAGEMVMILDACYSASAVATAGFKPGPMGSRGLGQLSYDKGMRILSATQANDVAQEIDRLQHGLLTYVLIHDGLDELKADVNPSDGVITMRKWLSYGASNVSGSAARGELGDDHAGVQQAALFDFVKGQKDTVLIRIAAAK